MKRSRWSREPVQVGISRGITARADRVRTVGRLASRAQGATGATVFPDRARSAHRETAGRLRRNIPPAPRPAGEAPPTVPSPATRRRIPAQTTVSGAVPGPAVRMEGLRATGSASSRGLKASDSGPAQGREATVEDAPTGLRARRAPLRSPGGLRAARRAGVRVPDRVSGDREAVRTGRLEAGPVRAAGAGFQDPARVRRRPPVLAAATGRGAFLPGTAEGPVVLTRLRPRPLCPRPATALLLTVRAARPGRLAAAAEKAGTATLAAAGKPRTGGKTGGNFNRRARAAAAGRTTALRCARRRGRARFRWTDR